MLDRPIVIINGTLIEGTGKPALQNSAVSILGSKVVATGRVGEVNVPGNAEIIDATGKTVLPGFIDSHTHFILMGVRTLTTLDLSKTESISEVIEQVKMRAKELPKGTWLTGHGWDESAWSEKKYPTKEDLDQAAQDNPVVLTPYYGHLMVVNTRALELARISSETPNPPGGRIDQDLTTGEVTGVLREEAMKLIENVKPPITEDIALKGLEKACEIALRWGCTSIHELVSTPRDFYTYQTALETGRLKVRAYVMPTARSTTKMIDGLEALNIRTRFGSEFLRIGSVKIYIDGSMGARTAVFSEPYADDPSTSGLFTISPEELKQKVVKAHEVGLQVAIHAIGDKGIEESLLAIETAQKKDPREDPRHRIEHCEVLMKNQISRIKQSKIVLSMQPNFIGEWGQPGGMYEQRLGKNRLKYCNPYRKLLDEGIMVAFGSDCGYCPPWPFNPLFGLWSAINHPIKGHRITLEEAVRCYTLNGAYASFEEEIKGSIEPGKLADIIILSEDLTAIAAEQIKDVKVELTMVNGTIQWRTDG